MMPLRWRLKVEIIYFSWLGNRMFALCTVPRHVPPLDEDGGGGGGLRGDALGTGAGDGLSEKRRRKMCASTIFSNLNEL